MNKNTLHFPKKILLFILLLLSTVLYGQSRYLENGIGGSCFQINTVIDSNGLNTIGASGAYSIGGIMDFGFSLDRSNGLIDGNDSTEWNFDFLYNIVIVKQTDNIPISMQLEGTYGFSNSSSDYLTTTDKTLESQGFSLGASLYREFNKNGLFSFLIGAKGLYNNFVWTEVDNGLNTTSSERKEDFLWGVVGGVSLKPPKWPIFTIEVEFLYDQTAEGFYIEPAFLFISPSI